MKQLSLRPVVGITGHLGHFSRPWLVGTSLSCSLPGAQRHLRAGPQPSPHPYLEAEGAPKTSSTTITPKVGGRPPTRLPASPIVSFALCLALLGPESRPHPPLLACWGGDQGLAPRSYPHGVGLGSWDNGFFLQPGGCGWGNPRAGGGRGGAESPSLARALHASPLPPPGCPTKPSQPPLDS